MYLLLLSVVVTVIFITILEHSHKLFKNQTSKRNIGKVSDFGVLIVVAFVTIVIGITLAPYNFDASESFKLYTFLQFYENLN